MAAPKAHDDDSAQQCAMWELCIGDREWRYLKNSIQSEAVGELLGEIDLLPAV